MFALEFHTGTCLRRLEMHDWLGIGLFALGTGIARGGISKHRTRMRAPRAPGRSDRNSPPWAK